MNLNSEELKAQVILITKCKSTMTGPWALTASDWVTQLIAQAPVCVQNSAMPSVVLAQAITESGWGSTGILFGIKATKEDFAAGLATKHDTHEEIDGVLRPQIDYFFTDKSIAANFQRYFKYLKHMKPNSGDFLKAMGTDASFSDRQGFLSNLQTPPDYSTLVNVPMDYYATIASVIHSNNLWAFDHV